MKKIIQITLLLIATTFVMSSCNKSEDDPISKEIAGVYEGELTVYEQQIPASISIIQTGETVTLSMKDPALIQMLQLPAGLEIGAENVSVEKSLGIYSLEGQGSVKVEASTIKFNFLGTGNPAAMKITITVKLNDTPGGELVVVFNGSRK